MASPSSPQKNAEPLAVERVARLLRNGSLHEAGRAGVAQAVKHLVSLGLIETVTAEYVRCADHRDPDYRYVRNRSCRGRIRIEDDADDDGDGLYCPECGRKVYPRGKARCRIVQVEVKPEGVAAFLEGLLKEGNLESKQVYPWVWRVDTPRGEARLVVADYCGLEHACRDWAAANRACYVVVDAASCKTRFLPEPWLVWTRLADVVCGSVKLADLVSSAAATVPTSQVRASIPVYSATVRPIIAAQEQQKPNDLDRKKSAPKTWPDPCKHTTAKIWTTQDGIFHMATKTKGQRDGEVQFPLAGGKPTKQMQIMKLLCHKHEQAKTLAFVIDQVYPEMKDSVRRDGKALAKLLKTIRTLVSDIRNKKLAPAGINPDILPALDIEVTGATTIGLKLAHIHDLDVAGLREPRREDNNI
jgi:hypothetical protein